MPVRAQLSGWGGWPRREGWVDRPEMVGDVKIDEYIQKFGSLLARGLGKSYGDAAQNTEGITLLTERLDRFLEWEEGVLTAEAGVSLDEVLRVFVPRGWFPPVVPGTRFLTLGGMVAADVHGKNQHRAGTFGRWVLGLRVLLPSGERVWLSREDPRFRAVVGGMGMGGIILDIKFKMVRIKSSFIYAKNLAFGSLAEAEELMEAQDPGWEFSVAWLMPGEERGVLSLGRYYPEGPLRPPKGPRLRAPGLRLARRFLVEMAYYPYYLMERHKEGPVPMEKFFWPLDGIRAWNRAYGRRGFLQYQFVVPLAEGTGPLSKVIRLLRDRGHVSYLTVLKRFGQGGAGLLSFPMPGYTLAMDFPLERGLLDALREADRIVMDYGGRVYLAKDARMSREAFSAFYPDAGEWLRVVALMDPGARLRSDMARRLWYA